jgi:ribose-phosphate pyrophosphokinase
MSDDRMMVFTGNANPQLAHDVVSHLSLDLGKIKVTKFSDGETHVELLENVRGKDVFIVQPTCDPTNDNIMELLIMVDAMHRASAGRVTAVIPYFGYARQDRRVRSRRVPISAKVVAGMISNMHVDRVLTIDLHAEQVQGFFDVPVDNIYASNVLVDDIRKRELENLIVVSPDIGGVVRARALAKQLDDRDLAIIDKRRPAPNQSEVMNIIGDVKGKACVIVDDLVDTAGTLCNAAKALKEHGAASVDAYATHPVFSGKAMENIENSELDSITITDTIPLSERAKNCAKIRQLTVAGLLAETLKRIYHEESVSELFQEN